VINVTVSQKSEQSLVGHLNELAKIFVSNTYSQMYFKAPLLMNLKKYFPDFDFFQFQLPFVRSESPTRYGTCRGAHLKKFSKEKKEYSDRCKNSKENGRGSY